MQKNREELERIFCWKIHAELKGFQYRMMQREKEEVYAAAYQIDRMIQIYEVLAEMSQYMETESLENSLSVPNVLAFLYERWLEYKTSNQRELETCLTEEIEKMKQERSLAV